MAARKHSVFVFLLIAIRLFYVAPLQCPVHFCLQSHEVAVENFAFVHFSSETNKDCNNHTELNVSTPLLLTPSRKIQDMVIYAEDVAKCWLVEGKC
jgi:hypothetical protein